MLHPNPAEEGIISPPAFARINSNKVQADTVKFNLNTIKMTTQTPPGRIIISVKDKLTSFQFRQLINKTVTENENQFGSLIIIKAPGHQPFRQIIKDNQIKITPIKFAIDSVKRIQPINISFQDSILNAKPEIKAGSITFKVDTLKLNTTQPAKSKNRANNGKTIKPKKVTETEDEFAL